MTSTCIILSIPVGRPVFSLTVLLQEITKSSSDFVISLMRAGIKSLNNKMTRQVVCVPYKEDQETSAVADTDICCALLAEVACNPELLKEYFQEDPRMILDWHVLNDDQGEYHIGFEIENDSIAVRRIPRLKPEDVPNYRFVKVILVGH